LGESVGEPTHLQIKKKECMVVNQAWSHNDSWRVSYIYGHALALAKESNETQSSKPPRMEQGESAKVGLKQVKVHANKCRAETPSQNEVVQSHPCSKSFKGNVHKIHVKVSGESIV